MNCLRDSWSLDLQHFGKDLPKQPVLDLGLALWPVIRPWDEGSPGPLYQLRRDGLRMLLEPLEKNYR